MYQLNWEKIKEQGIRLLGVEGFPTELSLPETIEGLPVTEVGPYCFAKNKYLEAVNLPDTVTKIDRMAFYNCTSLKTLELGKNLAELGGDAFMNCHNLHKLVMRCGATEKSGLRLVLQQISHDMRVQFVNEAGEIEAVVLFSEYYETYDEVAPAHLFGRNIEGEGFRARQYFKDGVFEFARYDGIFAKACAEETIATLCEMALNRLRYPFSLKDEAKSSYGDYVTAHMTAVGRRGIVDRDMELFSMLCEEKLMTRTDLMACVKMAAEEEWVEGAAYLLRLKEQYFEKKEMAERYSFDDF